MATRALSWKRAAAIGWRDLKSAPGKFGFVVLSVAVGVAALVGVRGQRPEEVEYAGSAESLQQVWIALRSNLRKVLENVTVADVAEGRLPKDVLALTRAEEAWQTR